MPHSLGFLSDTPDGTAFALNGHAEGFIDRKFSVGPLLQLAATGDLAQIGLSGQAKYWIDIPGTENRLKVTVQGGIGFVPPWPACLVMTCGGVAPAPEGPAEPAA